MQPHPMTSVMQLAVTAAAVTVAACAMFTVWTWREHRNADLVRIGVSVLRVDPETEKQISAARKWALELIDANAGGVTFSQEAKEQLLREPLKYSVTPGYGGAPPGAAVAPIPHSPEPPK